MFCFRRQKSEENNINQLRHNLEQPQNRKKLLLFLKCKCTKKDQMISRKEFRSAILKCLHITATNETIDTIFNEDILKGRKHGELSFTELQQILPFQKSSFRVLPYFWQPLKSNAKHIDIKQSAVILAS